MKGRGTIIGLMVAGLVASTAAEGAKVKARIRFDPETRSGTDGEGRVLLYAPKPLQLGSSHSHFDFSLFPNALMEPGINADLGFGDVDLTLAAMEDYGWPRGTFTAGIRYADAAGTGFDDPVRGAERRMAFEAAAAFWAELLGSAVQVNIEASFDELRCDDDGATLARAGPRFAFVDFAGGEPGVWHAGPLAEAIAGENLSLADNSDPDATDIGVTFNSRIDEACLGAGTSFYYGLDGNAPSNQRSFVAVALHEIGHGLGFLGLVDLETGALFRGRPDVHTTLTLDTKKNLYWDEMTDRQRKSSAVRAGKLSFDGERTTEAADSFLGGSVVVKVRKPKRLRTTYAVAPAEFGPQIEGKGIRRNLVLVDDGSDKPTLACEPILNAGALAGKIAVIDRGECFFVDKVRNAQDAGAVAVIVVNNVSGPPPVMGGSDPAIEIPAVHIAKNAGKKIKKTLRK